MGVKPFDFGDNEQSTEKKPARRERFLGEMEAVVPWNALIAVATMHRFTDIALVTDPIPEKTTIMVFRHRLEDNDRGAQISKQCRLTSRGKWCAHAGLHPLQMGKVKSPKRRNQAHQRPIPL